MKGLELPMNMIVVILIAVLVLVVLGAFFAGQMGSGQNTVALQSAFSSSCTTFRTVYNCANMGFETSYIKPGDTTNHKLSFSELCAAMNYATADNTCQKACGCAV